MDFHPFFLTALKLVPQCIWPACMSGPNACHTTHAYTDCSCSTDSSDNTLLGWSCVLLAEDESGSFFFAGWMADSASHDSLMLGGLHGFYQQRCGAPGHHLGDGLGFGVAAPVPAASSQRQHLRSRCRFPRSAPATRTCPCSEPRASLLRSESLDRLLARTFMGTTGSRGTSSRMDLPSTRLRRGVLSTPPHWHTFSL